MKIPRWQNKNIEWGIENLSDNNKSFSVSKEDAALCVLMDIRDALKQLNLVFSCQNARDIPGLLRKIDKNTRKPRRKKK